MAKFLDQKQTQDPSWKSARKSYAPGFGIVAQVLKKNQLKEAVKPAIYMEQDSRPRMLYTEEDWQLLEEAWTLTAAHREDLACSRGNPQDPPALIDDKPSVMDLLQRTNG